MLKFFGPPLKSRSNDKELGRKKKFTDLWKIDNSGADHIGILWVVSKHQYRVSEKEPKGKLAYVFHDKISFNTARISFLQYVLVIGSSKIKRPILNKKMEF